MSMVTLPPFQRLIDDHGTTVHRFLAARVGAVDADDCWQETFLAALRAYPELAHGAELRAWLMTIAHHTAVDHLRARARRPVAVADVQADDGEEAAGGARIGGVRVGGVGGVGGGDGSPADGGPDPIWAQVATLPDKQRTAVALRFVADLSHAQIGAVMGTTDAAARRNVHEGLTRLRKEIDQ